MTRPFLFHRSRVELASSRLACPMRVVVRRANGSFGLCLALLRLGVDARPRTQSYRRHDGLLWKLFARSVRECDGQPENCSIDDESHPADQQ